MLEHIVVAADETDASRGAIKTALRWAARDRATRFAGDDLDALRTQIDVEAGALRHWTTAEPTPAEKPTTTTTSAPPPWPAAPAAGGAASQQTWPDNPGARRAAEPDRPAITPPVQQPTYPWQKKPRPESTT